MLKKKTVWNSKMDLEDLKGLPDSFLNSKLGFFQQPFNFEFMAPKSIFKSGATTCCAQDKQTNKPKKSN